MPLPPRAALRDLLSDLLGRPVTIAEGAPQVLRRTDPGTAAAYRRDDGSVGAVCIASGELALGAGAALGLLPAGEALDTAEAREEALANFHEVLNVLSRVLNSPMTSRVVLAETATVPGPVAADVARVVTDPDARRDYRVVVDEYGQGPLTVLRAS